MLPIRSLTVVALALLPLSLQNASAASGRRVDPARSEVRFEITKLGFANVHGRFERMDARIHYDAQAPERSVVEWRVPVASVKTDATNRDRTLQGPQYFDAARYPHMSFVSRRVRPLDAHRLEVEGDITIKGITRPLTVTVRRVGTHRFESDFELDRFAFDVTASPYYRYLIGRTVRVHLVAVLAEVAEPPSVE